MKLENTIKLIPLSQTIDGKDHHGCEIEKKLSITLVWLALNSSSS